MEDQDRYAQPGYSQWSFAYSGERRDASGLLPYGFRTFSPAAGRWLSPDPAGPKGSLRSPLNFYQMVDSNPATRRDHRGLMGLWQSTPVSEPEPVALGRPFILFKDLSRFLNYGGNRPLGDRLTRDVHAVINEYLSRVVDFYWMPPVSLNNNNLFPMEPSGGSYYRHILQDLSETHTWLTPDAIISISHFVSNGPVADYGFSLVEEFNRSDRRDFIGYRLRYTFHLGVMAREVENVNWPIIMFLNQARGTELTFKRRYFEDTKDSEEFFSEWNNESWHVLLNLISNRVFAHAMKTPQKYIPTKKLLKIVNASGYKSKQYIRRTTTISRVWHDIADAFRAEQDWYRSTLAQCFYEFDYADYNRSYELAKSIIDSEVALRYHIASGRDKKGERFVYYPLYDTRRRKLLARSSRKKIDAVPLSVKARSS